MERDGAKRYWLLARPGILRILAILYEHGPMPLHRIPRYGMGVGTTYRSASDAAMLGLITLYYCGNSKCAKLTEKGRRVAEKLAELLKTLEELDLVKPEQATAQHSSDTSEP
ncbi:hypothetical protein [Hyperthermus butylicus]|uniref:Uncharacterized protein n=1 Tax=Hyperthermus butylicus (strain DSM 5456 / JCM 9403 / PLM1-5) TaxID=415426 RepID=A2BJ29_HYPBU|nr:hypothetical protein [Hyperthermus butylicus]ABM79990.1 hypothetical protein Hbut_0115 [Hyperthermus butylicus DSM 5456]